MWLMVCSIVKIDVGDLNIIYQDNERVFKSILHMHPHFDI